MQEEVRALTAALDVLRDRLISTTPTDPGFAAVRGIYLQLTKALVIVGDRADAELARELVVASRAASVEWAQSWHKSEMWMDVLLPVVDAVGVMLERFRQPNPLLVFVT